MAECNCMVEAEDGAGMHAASCPAARPMVEPPLVYVAGPYSAATRAKVEVNIARATGYGLEIARMGGMPVVPHSNTSDDRYAQTQPYEFWMLGTAKLLRACDAVFMMPTWRASSGAQAEEKLARSLKLPIFFELEVLRLWIAPRVASSR